MPQDPLSILVIEPKFPGRLGAVADWLVTHRGYRASFYCHNVASPEFWPGAVGKGLEVVAYNVGGVAKESSVPWPKVLERGLCHSYGCWEVLENRRPRPIDAIIGHSDGLGSTLFAQVAYPRVPILQLFDGFLQPHRHDLSDDSPGDTPSAFYHWRRASNAMDLLDLENGVRPWIPTAWQRDLYPAEYRDDFLVLHDGVDTRTFRPENRTAGGDRVVLGRKIPAGTKLVTYVAQTLESVRGFDRFFRLANALIARRDDVLCLAIGDPVVTRSLDIAHYGGSFLQHLLDRTSGVNADRFWCTGAVPPQGVAQVLAASDLQVYPSRVHAASRSLTEAMASGCTILAGDQAPNREFLEHDASAILVPPGEDDAWLAQAGRMLDEPGAFAHLGRNASAVAKQKFSREVNLPRLAEHLQTLAGLDQRPNARMLATLSKGEA